MKNNKTSLSSREVATRDLRIFISAGTANKQETIRRPRITNFRGDRPLYYNSNSGFTLIELLVVVLIIGILAAVELPQYQKAVEKSRAAQVLPLLKSVYTAAETYYLANGKAASSFDDLSVDIPWTGTRKWYDNYASPVKSNNDWSLQLYFDAAKKEPAISVGRLTGKYKGGGFMIYLQSAVNGLPKATPVCVERRTDGVNFTEDAGSYCKNIMKGTLKSTHSTMRWYTLP